ncbi:MAG: response regulator [Bacteroidota bacterium]
MMVAIIDDEFRSIEMIEWLLSMYFEEAKPMMFSNPKEALVAINEKQPPLIFMDIQMPYMTGFELASQIEQYNPYIIFITAYNGAILNTLFENKVPHLLKPIDHEDFQQKIAQFKNASEITTRKEMLSILSNKFNEGHFS